MLLMPVLTNRYDVKHNSDTDGRTLTRFGPWAPPNLGRGGAGSRSGGVGTPDDRQDQAEAIRSCWLDVLAVTLSTSSGLFRSWPHEAIGFGRLSGPY
jgi:hypothetical protein